MGDVVDGWFKNVIYGLFFLGKDGWMFYCVEVLRGLWKRSISYVDSQIRTQRTFNNLMFGSCRVEHSRVNFKWASFKAPLGSECTPA